MTNSAGPEFVMGGYRNGISMGSQIIDGYYWPSSAYFSPALSYRMRLVSSNSSVYPAGNENKYIACSLRYLAEVGPTRFIFTSPPLLLPEKEKQSCSLHPHHLPTTH